MILSHLYNLKEPNPAFTLFKSFMDQCPIMAWITDPAGNIIYSNKAHQKTFKIAEKDCGKTLFDLFSIKHSKAFKRHNDLVLELNSPISIVVSPIFPDHSEKYYKVNKFPIAINGQLCVGGWAMECREEDYKGKIELLMD